MKPRHHFSSTRLAAMVLLPAVLLGFGAVAHATTEENLEKSFTVTPGSVLIVEVDFGSIDVSTNADNQTSIRVLRKVSYADKADEEAFFQEHPVTFSQEGNTVTVRATPTTKGKRPGAKQTQARYTITLPCVSDVMLKTAGGGINVRDLQGNAKAETAGGDLVFTRLHGPVVGRTAGGSVKVLDCDGSLKVNTGGGKVDVNGGGGSLDGRSGGGSLAVKDFRGSARVETGGGGIQIENVTGKIEGATAGGSITATLSSVSDEVKLRTSGGGVTLRAPSDAAFDLDASTAGGQAKSELPVATTGKPSPGHLKGPVNGGGKPVVLRSSGGSVRVEKL